MNTHICFNMKGFKSIKRKGVSVSLITLVLISLLGMIEPAEVKSNNKLLLVLLDGMRWDTDMPALQSLAAQGIRAERLRPCFPADSFPNYYCIATGLYCESHGMVGNNIYDVAENDSFKIDLSWPNDKKAKWWDDGEPIWVTAVKQGKRVKMYHWPGCEMTIRGVTLNSDQCVPYTSYMNGSAMVPTVEDALQELVQDKVDFLAIYQEQPDGIQHKYGVGSTEAQQVLGILDNALNVLHDGLENFNVADTHSKLKDVLNVMVVSDHGHTVVKKGDTDWVNVTAVLNMDDVIHVLRSGAVFSVWPKEGRHDAVLEALSSLQHLNVYRKEDIPERLFYKHHRFVAPIVAIVGLGYIMLTPDSPDKPSGHFVSTHGYDSENTTDMDGIFLATGPNIKRGVHPGPIDNVELYQIMCAVLGVSSAPNNGSWNNVEGFLQGLSAPPQQGSSATKWSLDAVLIVFLFIIFINAFY